MLYGARVVPSRRVESAVHELPILRFSGRFQAMPIRSPKTASELRLNWCYRPMEDLSAQRQNHSKWSRIERRMWSFQSADSWGRGKRLVAVPFSEVRIVGKEMQLPDATKDALKSLPEFKYAPN
jgi:hypothetical protein